MLSLLSAAQSVGILNYQLLSNYTTAYEFGLNPRSYPPNWSSFGLRLTDFPRSGLTFAGDHVATYSGLANGTSDKFVLSLFNLSGGFLGQKIIEYTSDISVGTAVVGDSILVFAVTAGNGPASATLFICDEKNVQNNCSSQTIYSPIPPLVQGTLVVNTSAIKNCAAFIATGQMLGSNNSWFAIGASLNLGRPSTYQGQLDFGTDVQVIDADVWLFADNSGFAYFVTLDANGTSEVYFTDYDPYFCIDPAFDVDHLHKLSVTSACMSAWPVSVAGGTHEFHMLFGCITSYEDSMQLFDWAPTIRSPRFPNYSSDIDAITYGQNFVIQEAVLGFLGDVAILIARTQNIYNRSMAINYFNYSGHGLWSSVPNLVPSSLRTAGDIFTISYAENGSFILLWRNDFSADFTNSSIGYLVSYVGNIYSWFVPFNFSQWGQYLITGAIGSNGETGISLRLGFKNRSSAPGEYTVQEVFLSPSLASYNAAYRWHPSGMLILMACLMCLCVCFRLH